MIFFKNFNIIHIMWYLFIKYLNIITLIFLVPYNKNLIYVLYFNEIWTTTILAMSTHTSFILILCNLKQ